MQAFDDATIAERIRELLANRDISISDMARRIDVPYRTLQNQLLGKSKMPTSTFLRLIETLKIPASYISHGRFDLGRDALARTLNMCLGSLLPVVSADDKGGITLSPPAAVDTRTADERAEHSRWLAFAVELNYQAFAAHPKD